MKVKLAKTAGFCMGVRRAMEKVLAEANKSQTPIYTFGPLIHNTQVMDLLKSKGVLPVENIDNLTEGTIVIRAHGIPPNQRKILRSSKARIIDATCPRVAKVQSIIRYHTKKGYSAVIIGDEDHPEVIGLKGYGNDQAHVINSPESVADLPDMAKVIVVAQTTQDEIQFRKIVRLIKGRFPSALIFDTICDATRNRQKEVRTLAEHVDGLVIVGGFHSGNTRRLAQISQAAGKPTFHVETEEELDKEKLASMAVIGVTAGASTPNWMLKNVVNKLENIRGHRRGAAGRWARNTLKIMLLSNIIVALGAFSLSFAVAFLSGRKSDLIYPVLAFLYVYAMHVLNRFLDKGASTYNDPERALFYRKHKNLLIITGILSILGALGYSLILNRSIFFAMAGLILLGVIYSFPIFPISRKRLGRYFKIKDIPGSKTFSQALAWGAVISLLPLLESEGVVGAASAVSFLFVISAVFIRSALFDIFQVQGDLIVGTETLPIILGIRRTLRLLKGFIFAASLILMASPLFGLTGPFSFLMIVPLIFLLLSMIIYEKGWLYPGIRLEFLVEGNFFLAGILSLAWYLLS